MDGATFKAWRKKMGLTAADVAEICTKRAGKAVSIRSVHSWEQSWRKVQPYAVAALKEWDSANCFGYWPEMEAMGIV